MSLSEIMSSDISVTLSSSTDSLWKSCYDLEHEMILTVNGRRIFPTLEYSVTGLDPTKMYSMCLHIDLVDDKKLRFVGGNWMESMSTEKKEAPRKVWHHNGAQTGKDWMTRNINFDQIRITNRKSKEEVNASYVHLHTQHRYIPVITIYEGSEIAHIASVPHSQFITVTAYHRGELNTLKTNSNPYSTGSRKDRRRDRQSPTSSAGSSSENSLSPPPSKRVKTEISDQLQTIKEENDTFTPMFPSFTPAIQPDFQMLQAFFLAQFAPKNNPSPPPTTVKEEEVPAINTPILPTFTPEMLQPMFIPQYGFPFNPFLNPFFSPYSSMFQTPAASPVSDEIKEIKTETDTVINVV